MQRMLKFIGIRLLVSYIFRQNKIRNEKIKIWFLFAVCKCVFIWRNYVILNRIYLILHMFFQLYLDKRQIVRKKGDTKFYFRFWVINPSWIRVDSKQLWELYVDSVELRFVLLLLADEADTWKCFSWAKQSRILINSTIDWYSTNFLGSSITIFLIQRKHLEQDMQETAWITNTSCICIPPA